MSEQEIPTQPQSQPSSAAALFVDLKNSIDALAEAQAPKSVKIKIEIHNEFATSKFFSSTLEILGWIIFGLGILVLLVSLVSASSTDTTYIFGFSAPLVSGAALALSGLFQVGFSQIVAAETNLVNYARQSLQLQAAAITGEKSIDTRAKDARVATATIEQDTAKYDQW